jgi:hypothetical protein
MHKGETGIRLTLRHVSVSMGKPFLLRNDSVDNTNKKLRITILIYTMPVIRS